jgi:hypothetical protein
MPVSSCSSVVAVALFLVGALPMVCSSAAEVATTAPNLVENGSFATRSAAGLAQGWSLSGAGVSSVGTVPGEGDAQSASQSIVSDGTSALLFSQDVAVEPGAEYFFSARVKSGDRIVAQVGTVRMAYTEFGQWQKLVGTIRTAKETTVRMGFTLGGFTGKPDTFLVQEVLLRRVEMPPLPPRASYGTTTLGSAAAFIIYPASIPAYRELAAQVAAAVKAQTGVDLPLVADVEATEAPRPVIREPYRSAHLILLGRLGINRAMWSAYNHFLCATTATPRAATATRSAPRRTSCATTGTTSSSVAAARRARPGPWRSSSAW